MKEMKSSAEVSKGIKADIKKLTTTVKETNSTLKKYMDKTDKEIADLQEQSTSTNIKVKSLEDTVTAISDQSTRVEERLKKHEETIDVLAKKNKQMEDEKKRQNIVIDGSKEETNKHPRQQVMELFSDIKANIKADDVTAAIRLGPGNPKST